MGTPSGRADRDAVFELAAFLVSSARGAIEEGGVTASLRLIEATARLASLGDALAEDEFVTELGALIRTGADASYLESRESYLAFLDRVLARVAREVQRRNPSERAPGA
jgi:hypothetical protein